MRRLTALALSAALVVPVALALVPTAGADEARDARLLVIEGKFDEAGKVIEGAPDEIKGDAGLRLQLAESAIGELRKAEGDTLLSGLLFARDNYTASFQAEPSTKALEGAMESCRRLAEQFVTDKKPDKAQNSLGFAIGLVETGLERVETTPELKAEIARVYGTRGDVADATKSADQILSDFAKGSDLLAVAADGHTNAAEWLSEAAEMRLRAAQLVLDRLPEGDERGPANVRKAVEFATASCGAEGARKPQYTTHLKSLRMGRHFGMDEDLGKPFMEVLGKPEVPGLELKVPMAEGWTFDANKDWNLLVTRRIPGDMDNQVVQIMVTRLPKNQPELGETWADPEAVCEARHEVKRESDFDDIVREIPAMQLGDKKILKKDPKVFYFELGGTKDGRRRLLAEWLWTPSKKSEHSYHIRVLDWGTPWTVDDPDIVAFLQSAFGEERYPISQEQREKIYKKLKKRR